MRKSLFLSLSALMFIACGNSQPATAQQKTDTKKEVKGVQTEVIHLTLNQFREKVANINANSSEWKYLGDKPAIIDFYADWCGPCKKIAPILDKLSVEYSDKIYIYKVDTQKERELSALFGIQSIPSLLFIPMNGQPQMAAGALPEADLKKAINEFLLLK